MPREQHRRSIQDSEEIPFSPLYLGHNYFYPENIKPDRYDRLPEKIRELEELVNKRRAKLKAQAQENSYLGFRIPDDVPDSEAKLQRILKANFRKFHKLFPNQEILDDARSPVDTSDFIFREDDLNVDDEYDQPTRNVLDNNIRYEEEDGKLEKESSGTEDVREEKSEDEDFAYAPPDPRFYKEFTHTGKYIFKHLLCSTSSIMKAY